jgi:hypothetical protein
MDFVITGPAVWTTGSPQKKGGGECPPPFENLTSARWAPSNRRALSC